MNEMKTENRICARCGKSGPVADDQTDPKGFELALDSLGLVARNEYACGECLEAAEEATYRRGRPEMS